ncbi:MAG: hypothetical protein FJ095_21225 [Deltaproteobacteria bacterium]|nr:hypothetical protein [Deltaproteobacteria bacterium]
MSEEGVPANNIEPLRYRRYPVGQALSVEWDGKPCDARVTAVEGDVMRITCPGRTSVSDERLLSNRVVAEQGAARAVRRQPAVLTDARPRGRGHAGPRQPRRAGP